MVTNKKQEQSLRVICHNKKARHNYHIVETMEAGIVLLGSEVKSCRRGSVNLNDSHALIENGEIFLVDAHISPYAHANRFNHQPRRKRKLLLHKHQIKKLYGKIKERGQTFIPLRMYFNEAGKVKVEMAIAQGKKLFDKRADIQKRDLLREEQRRLQRHS
ncbi:MAG: SsrA-binding protein SmpB [Desulfobacterota bacterium]|nr:SsrA-binding protein SmpB [Thermodesulfobacteriota bacterium]